MKKISIILPFYNAEKTLSTCLESILAQSYHHFECLCIDDGSTDSSAALVESYIAQDSRIILIRQENKRQGGARNKGMEHAQGEWISFIDADDAISPRMLELLLHAAETTQAQIAACDTVKSSEPYDSTVFTTTTLQAEPVLIDDPLGAYIHKKGIITSVCARLYHRDLLNDYRFVENLYFEDTPWLAEILGRCTRYARLKTPLYYYYHNKGSTMRSNWSEKKTEDFVFVLRCIFERTVEFHPARVLEMRDYHLTPLLKMVFNRIRKSPTNVRQDLWDHASPLICSLYNEGCIGYKGLKWKHKWRLWKLLREGASH